jgi:DNA topoisomerase-1
LPVLVRKGPYGAYIQLGDADTKKPKRGTIPKKMEIPNLTLETGLGLLNLPREIGLHPESGEMITAGIGRYGPFIRFGSTYISIPDDDSVLTIGLNFAIDAIAKSGKTAGRNVGDHPDGGSIMLKSGRFGPYVEHDKIRATIPKAYDPDTLTLDEAIDLIAKKKAKGPGKAPPRGKTTKTAKAKTSPKASTAAKKRK